MQTAVVIVVVIAASVYAAWRIREAVINANDPCRGCQGCALKDAKSRNQPCEKKKEAEKFGRKKKKS